MGIRRISEVCFGVGSFLMLIVLFMDETFHVLNLFVQSVGFYFQNVIQIGTHTYTYEQLDMYRFVPEGKENPDGPKGKAI